MNTYIEHMVFTTGRETTPTKRNLRHSGVAPHLHVKISQTIASIVFKYEEEPSIHACPSLNSCLFSMHTEMRQTESRGIRIFWYALNSEKWIWECKLILNHLHNIDICNDNIISILMNIRMGKTISDWDMFKCILYLEKVLVWMRQVVSNALSTALSC